MTGDQAERALSRLREAGYPASYPTVAALLDRLETTDGKRRANAVRGWWGKAGDVAERRTARSENGTAQEQRGAYRDYMEQLEMGLEAATNGQMLKPRSRGAGVRTADILTGNADTIRKHASEEALRYFAETGPPLTFDAWRYANLGIRDKRATAAYQRRTGGFFSEHG